MLIPSLSLRASTTWDDILTGTWDVPALNLLAYTTSGTDLSNPQAVQDQTIWTITCVNGVITGTSQATLTPPGSISNTTMTGVISESGQLRIIFSASGTPPTVGIGQIRNVNGTNYAEMQMLTGTGGTGGIYITHWAYMAPVPPPEPLVVDTELWDWVEGTTWALESPDVFGSTDPGSFFVESANKGYFWGTALAPDGSGNYSLIGSITPEGNVLFNVLNGDTLVLTSLTGQITGTASNGQMALRTYESDGDFGPAAYAQVIPEPSASGLMAGALAFLVVWRGAQRSKRARMG